MTHAAPIFQLGEFLATQLGNIHYLSFSLCGDFESPHGFSLPFEMTRSMLELNGRVGRKKTEMLHELWSSTENKIEGFPHHLPWPIVIPADAGIQIGLVPN
jgi:hypothetical protein